jgi:putative Mg2+ transporter-C (MgtC) family protein
MGRPVTGLLAPTSAAGLGVFAGRALVALALGALTRDDYVLRAVRSENLDRRGGLVEVIAELQRYGRDDVALEAAVSRLSLEPGVSSVTWNVVESAVPLAAAEQ